MRRTFVKKEGVALASLARYLLGEQCGNRLKTIDELAAECQFSVGLIQAALKTLEHSGAIVIERRGRNGSYLVSTDNTALFNHLDLHNVVCAMPLPYTRLYEGLASGLKAQFQDMPFYFAHMRGADVRVECLLNGVYDMAVVSKLSAQRYLEAGDLAIAMALGPHSYVSEHRLICRQGERKALRRVGLDSRSTDQKVMTEAYFQNQAIELVNVSYHDCLSLIARGEIDAAIWNVDSETQLATLGLESSALEDNARFIEATQAVILTRADDYPVMQLVQMQVNQETLLAHQQRVVNGLEEPRY